MEKYATAFMKAMAPKRALGKWSELVYLDPLAGPGVGVDRDSRTEFDGSPLFFSKHPAGLTIWRGIKMIEPSGQRSLPI